MATSQPIIIKKDPPEWRQKMSPEGSPPEQQYRGNFFKKRLQPTKYQSNKKIVSDWINRFDIETPDVSDIKLDGQVKISKVKDVDWNVIRPARAGIIVYSREVDGLRFSLGVDAAEGDITDFGGGVSYRRDKTALHGAIREFYEESHGSYGKLSNLDNSLVIYDLNMLIIFAELPHDKTKVKNCFNKVKTIRSEVCELVWVYQDKFMSLLEGDSITSDDGLRRWIFFDRCRELIILADKNLGESDRPGGCLIEILNGC